MLRIRAGNNKFFAVHQGGRPSSSKGAAPSPAAPSSPAPEPSGGRSKTQRKNANRRLQDKQARAAAKQQLEDAAQAAKSTAIIVAPPSLSVQHVTPSSKAPTPLKSPATLSIQHVTSSWLKQHLSPALPPVITTAAQYTAAMLELQAILGAKDAALALTPSMVCIQRGGTTPLLIKGAALRPLELIDDAAVLKEGPAELEDLMGGGSTDLISTVIDSAAEEVTECAAPVVKVASDEEEEEVEEIVPLPRSNVISSTTIKIKTLPCTTRLEKQRLGWVGVAKLAIALAVTGLLVAKANMPKGKPSEASGRPQRRVIYREVYVEDQHSWLGFFGAIIGIFLWFFFFWGSMALRYCGRLRC